MVKLLRLYAKDNKSLVMIYFLISCISIFADALLLISLEAIIDSSLNETTINLILIYFICFLAQLFNSFILKQVLDVSLLNWMRKQLTSNIIRVPKTNYEVQPQTLHDIQLEKISTFINSLFSSLIRLISFIILNITIILNNNLVASSLLIFMFLITIISVFISKKLNKVSRNLSLKQSKNYDDQANIVENKLIIKNLKAKKFILDRYSQTLKSELDDFDNIQHIKESNWRLQELTFVVSNVLLPLLSLVLIISGHSETIILPLFISIAPRVSTSARIIANLILSYNEVLPIMDIYLSFFKKQESLDYWKETPKDCIIYISGTLPFVNKDVIDLKITERGLYTISGESGSGKTTILKLLSNLIDKPEDLTIKIKPNNKLEYVGIEPFYLDNTIKKNLMISTGKEEKFIINTVNMVSRVSGVKLNEKLNEKSEQYYANYSDGQKRLINLCHILLSNSNIILLDEPTSNLDQKTKLKIIDLLIKLSETRVIICTTHDRDLMSVSKRIVKLDKKGW